MHVFAGHITFKNCVSNHDCMHEGLNALVNLKTCLPHVLNATSIKLLRMAPEEQKVGLQSFRD